MIQRLLLVSCLFVFARCGLDCIDNKTGIHKSSATLQDSKTNGVFSFEMRPNKKVVKLDTGLFFKMGSAWVESDWQYECINNRAVVKKGSLLQLVINANCSGNIDSVHYWLISMGYFTGKGSGSALGERIVLNFSYEGQDSIKFAVVKSKSFSITKEDVVIDTIVFSIINNKPVL